MSVNFARVLGRGIHAGVELEFALREKFPFYIGASINDALCARQGTHIVM